VRADPTCPRCGGLLRPPGIWSSDWICAAHGAVLPRQPARRPSREGLTVALRDARVPLWTPWPLPVGWLVTGFLDVGDERSGARALATALSGPGLLQGPADMLVIAEEPGVGLGAHFAGLDGFDGGGAGDDTPPHAKIGIRTSGERPHQVPLWVIDGAPDRAVYIGEAMGNWLWIVLWPAETGVLVLEELQLLDLREPGMDLDLPYGAFCPRLRQ